MSKRKKVKKVEKKKEEYTEKERETFVVQPENAVDKSSPAYIK